MNNEINYECEFLHTYDDMRNYESECTFPLSKFKDCDKNNCVFKQLLAEQAKNKKLVEENHKLKEFLYFNFCENKYEPDKLIIEAGRAMQIFNLLNWKQALNEVNNDSTM